MNIPTGSSPHLENLIEAYSAAIWMQPLASAELGVLRAAVDREVARIGYSDKARIAALHDAAGRMSEVAA